MDRPFRCDLCPKDFICKGNIFFFSVYTYCSFIILIINHFSNRFEGHLKSHRRSHISERSFSCSYCHKRFVEKGNIMRHMKKYHPGQEMLPNIIEPASKLEQQQCVIGDFFMKN